MVKNTVESTKKAKYGQEYCQKYYPEILWKVLQCLDRLSMFGWWNKWSRIPSRIQQKLLSLGY